MNVYSAKDKVTTKAKNKKQDKNAQANNLISMWKKPAAKAKKVATTTDESAPITVSQLTTKSETSSNSILNAKAASVKETVSKKDVTVEAASVTSKSAVDDATSSKASQQNETKTKQKTRTFKLKGSQKITMGGASADYTKSQQQATESKRDDSTEQRTSSYQLRESLSLITSAQKAWINSGNKKRPLDDIIEPGVNMDVAQKENVQEEGEVVGAVADPEENEIATNFFSKSVNFKNKWRKYAPRAYFPNDPDAGATMRHTNAIFGDSSIAEEQKEQAPWAHEEGEFISKKKVESKDEIK